MKVVHESKNARVVEKHGTFVVEVKNQTNGWMALKEFGEQRFAVRLANIYEAGLRVTAAVDATKTKTPRG